MKNIIVNTSVDDLRSTLYLVNPDKQEDIQRWIKVLYQNIMYERTHKIRRSVINMLWSKIKKLEKKKA